MVTCCDDIHQSPPCSISATLQTFLLRQLAVLLLTYCRPCQRLGIAFTLSAALAVVSRRPVLWASALATD